MSKYKTVEGWPIEVGKEYTTRGGAARGGITIRIVKIEKNSGGYPVKSNTFTYTKRGKFYKWDGTCSLDLMRPAHIPEGFIKWDGGECPVHAKTLVCCFTDRSTIESVHVEAGSLRWCHIGICDIIAYKVIKPFEPEKENTSMTTKAQLQADAEALKKEFEEKYAKMTATINAMPDNKPVRIKEDMTVMLYGNGEAKNIPYYHIDAAFLQGNSFKTFKQAEARVKWQRLHTMLWDFSRRDGWEPDWSDVPQKKYYLYWGYGTETVDYGYCYNITYSNIIYFKSDNDAREAIKLLGDDAREYLTYSWF